MKKKKSEFDFSTLKETWPSILIARSEVRKFTGGLVSPKRLANEACQGTGPRSHRFGKKVFYNIDDLIAWLQQNAG